MKKISILTAVLSFFLFSAFTLAPQWSIDSDNSKLTFQIKNMGMWVDGSFDKVSGDVTFNPDDLGNSSVSATVDASSINTDNNQRDTHLRNPDYFEVETYPALSFKSRAFTKGKNGYFVTGTLTIKDVSKSVTLPFTFEDNTFKGSFSINRVDYNVGESSWVMGDKVNVKFILPVN